MKKKDTKLYIISGKARHGKDTTFNIIKDYFENKNLKCIQLEYGRYIKEFAKRISDWDGNPDTKPRALLQELGTNIIRNEIDSLFFVKRLCNDILVYSYYFDVIIISDARFPDEIDYPKDVIKSGKSINIVRPNFKSDLTKEQLAHPSETALDDYYAFDYVIINDGTIEELQAKVEKILGDDNNEH